MFKNSGDEKVKKHLVRNYEEKIRHPLRMELVDDDGASTSKDSMIIKGSSHVKFDEPTLCTSQALANYMGDLKNMKPRFAEDDLYVDKGKLSAKVTKKLNFPFDNRIYKNLVELNANIEEVKSKKDKRPASSIAARKDLEPNIEDFYHNEKEFDYAPKIPVFKPKFKAVENIENGQLHRLIASFELL